MGSRGAYEDVDKNNFTFKEGKQRGWDKTQP